ncbi:MAG: hypothetical protein U9N79_02725 [Actinomycetota bacterium]|nr:hypothetical protein [Actinomycetota bacterium]
MSDHNKTEQEKRAMRELYQKAWDNTFFTLLILEQDPAYELSDTERRFLEGTRRIAAEQRARESGGGEA